MFPTDCRYTKDHEWVRLEDGEYLVGITEYAANQLGDITFVELPEVGDDFSQGETVCTVESVKAASDVYAPVDGRVAEVNERLEAQSELVNESTYEDGWFFKFENVSVRAFEALMDAEAYEAFVATLTD